MKDKKDGWNGYVVVSVSSPDYRISPIFDTEKEAIESSKKTLGTKVIKTKSFPVDYMEAVTNKLIADIKGRLPKSIYVNSLRKYNKDIPVINAFNSYRKEVLKILRSYNK